MNINLKVRLMNPVFWFQILLAIMTPILAYAGLTASDMTSWDTLGELLLNALGNPYVLVLVGVSVWNAINDPTTEGLSDSSTALTYERPSGE